MAIRYAANNGNWSAVGTWDGGVSVPVDGDMVYTNNKTVTLDVAINQPNTTFLNTSLGSPVIAAGGTFQLGVGCTALTLLAATAGPTSLIQCQLTNGLCTISIATCTGGSGANGFSWNTQNGSTLTFSNCLFVGGSSGSCHGLSTSVSGTVTFTNCTARGGTNGSAYGVNIQSNLTYSGSQQISMSQAATTIGAAINMTSAVTNTITLTGTVAHQNSGQTLAVGGGTVNYTVTSETITGTPVSGTNGLYYVNGSGIINLTRPSGSFQMHNGTNGTHYLCKDGSAAIITCVGNITCGTGNGSLVAKDNLGGSGYISIDGTVTGPLATPNSNGLVASSGGQIRVKHLARNPSSGQLPSMAGNIIMFAGSTIVASTDTGTVTLVDASASADVPSAADVRLGTSYASGALTGTCAVPAAGSVALGVAVDATSGTAVLTPSDLPTTLIKTTIATLASQISFTLTTGSADNDAYNGATVVVTDASTSTQKCFGTVSDYVGSTKTITLSADPAVFTMAVGDTIAIVVGGSSGGGGTDWTSDEKTAIRSILGVPVSGTTPDDPTTGILDTIRDLADNIPTNTEFQARTFPESYRDKLLQAIKTAVIGTANTGCTTTSVVAKTLSPSASVTNQFVGLVMKFTDDTATTALRGQGATITASTAGGTFTVDNLTTAPSEDDIFVIQ